MNCAASRQPARRAAVRAGEVLQSRRLIAGLGLLATVPICIAIVRRQRQLRDGHHAKSNPPLSRDSLSMIAHELRTPLNSIVGWIGVLRSGKADAAVTATALNSMASSARAQRRLIEDIVDAMRTDRAQMRLRMRALDLRLPLAAAIDAARPTAQQRGLFLNVRVPKTACMVRGDHDRLQQAFGNLLGNAVKFTADGGIDVTLEQAGGRYEVRIVDTGKGIDRRFLPFVFRRFEQADRTGRRHGGLGLGLAICRDLVTQHRGRIRIDSEGPGRGTAVTVVLPERHGGPSE